MLKPTAENKIGSMYNLLMKNYLDTGSTPVRSTKVKWMQAWKWPSFKEFRISKPGESVVSNRPVSLIRVVGNIINLVAKKETLAS